MGHRPDHWPAVHTDFFSGQRLPIRNRVGLFFPPFQAERNTAGNAAYNNATFASGINFLSGNSIAFRYRLSFSV